jgi:hypothetical protein
MSKQRMHMLNGPIQDGLKLSSTPTLNPKEKASLLGLSFASQTREIEAYCNIFLFLVHPEQFRASLEARQMSKEEDMSREGGPRLQEGLDVWHSCFTGMSIMINRRTPDHRDVKGTPGTYDLLQILGKPRKSILHVPNLGINLVYHSRTGVLLAGRSLRHGVPDWKGEDRICIARWLRQAVLKHFQIPYPQYPSYANLLNYIRNA